MRVFLFLYHSYKPKFFWWEFVKMIYIFGLVFVKVQGIRLADPERLAMFMAVLTGFLFFNMAMRPHKYLTVYWLEVCGLGLVVVSTYML